MSNILPHHRASSILNQDAQQRVSRQTKNFKINTRKNQDNSRNEERNVYTNDNMHFSVPKKYVVLQVLGKGSYGTVCSARDVTVSNRQEGMDSLIAIKKITNIFQREILLKRAIRELKFMSLFQGHKNIVNPVSYTHLTLPTN